jgi:hypothetical protein
MLFYLCKNFKRAVGGISNRIIFMDNDFFRKKRFETFSLNIFLHLFRPFKFLLLNMKHKPLLIIFTLIANFAYTQIENDSVKVWQKGGMLSINFSQTALSNWSSGGQSSFSQLNQLSLFLNYEKEKVSWNNNLFLAYGLQRRDNDKAYKTDDKIDFSSKYGYRAFDHVNYSGILSFKTQFAPGYNNNSSNKISDFLAPAYIGLSLGLDYMPNDDFTVLLAPISNKNTYVNIQELADIGAFGVKKAILDQNGNILQKGHQFRAQLGGYFKMLIRKNIMENVVVQNQLDLFSDYLDNPGNIDIYWDVLVNFKINKFLAASVSSSLIYDDDIKILTSRKDGTKEFVGPRIQFKEILALGISYKM